jgi:hypothetical protein
MATPAQIAANRANARKSTGPRTPEGKAVSRFNALQHGAGSHSIVIPGEDPAAYDSLAADYVHEFQPQSSAEHFHIETMLRADWQKQRLVRVEADLTCTLLAENPEGSLAAALLSASPAAKLLTRIQRQIAGFERAWYRANAELRRARQHPADPTLDALEAELAAADIETRLQLASIRENQRPSAAQSEQASSTVREWPPVDPKTGRPAYFAG